MGDKVIKNLMKKPIVDSGNGENKAIVLGEKKLALKDEKRKTMWTQILVNEGYCVNNIEFLFLFLIKIK